jgi:hypothetical protein
MKFWNGMGAAAAALGLSLVAFGQGTTPPATCKTAPASVTALSFERAVPLANVLTTITPNADPAALAAIAGGALEIREQLVYNPSTGSITSTVFLVPTGSPLPSPGGTITGLNLVTITTAVVSHILTSCSLVPSLLFDGTVSGSTPGPTAYLYGGSLVGGSYALSLGYTTDTTPKINNVNETIAGVVTLWSAGATGTVTVPGGGTTPVGPGTGPTIVVKFANGTIAVPNSNTQAANSPFLLDASGSSSTGGALTFQWSTISNSPVQFQLANSAITLVQFPSAGDYVIQLVVTDASGASSTFKITLTFTGRPQ